MPITVNAAFNKFMTEYVNLESAQVAQARQSRKWLLGQINSFPSKYADFPRLYEDRHFGFGSFARSTKKQPLDDIDHLLCMSANGVTYSEVGDTIYMSVPENSLPFNKMLHDSGNFLNSIKVVNRFVKYLDQVPQYDKAEKKRNQEAATLNLTSYPWNFDIVPCFITRADDYGNDFYIIPDGKCHWKKTDPRLDKARTTRVNQLRNGNVLSVIRIMKYWNRRPTMASMGSYLLENMILDYYDTHSASQNINTEIANVLAYIRDHIFTSVNDPKNIQGNINHLTAIEKMSIYSRADIDLTKALEANLYASLYPSTAISKWQSIFGSNFPNYG